MVSHQRLSEDLNKPQYAVDEMVSKEETMECNQMLPDETKVKQK